jgi:hypothetical protein
VEGIVVDGELCAGHGKCYAIAPDLFAPVAHRRLGAHLLRVDVRVAMPELVRRIPEFELDPLRPPAWKQGQTSGMTSVPITFAPGEAENVVGDRHDAHF